MLGKEVPVRVAEKVWGVVGVAQGRAGRGGNVRVSELNCAERQSFERGKGFSSDDLQEFSFVAFSVQPCEGVGFFECVEEFLGLLPSEEALVWLFGGVGD